MKLPKQITAFGNTDFANKMDKIVFDYYQQ